MSQQFAKYEKTRRVGTLTFNAGQRMNAISEEGLAEIEHVLNAVEKDGDLGALILSGGTGNAFCVGLDFQLLDRGFADLDYLEAAVRRLAGIARRIEDLPIPTIAAVNGWARAAGFELALACDFILIADEAKFGDVHTEAGLLPIGGAIRLKARVGEQRAKELIWSSRWWTAAEAVASGLALRSVPREQLPFAVGELADSLAGKPRSAIEASKRVFQQHRGRTPEADAFEVDNFLAHVRSDPYPRQSYFAHRQARQSAPQQG
jgi:enoyl-CoA hydratase/carnithine racemase